MNISPSHSQTNYLANQLSLPIGKNQLANSRSQQVKTEPYLLATDNLAKTNNRSAINSFAFDDKASFTDNKNTNKSNTKSIFSGNINPNLLDTVFKLKSKQDQTEINKHRRSDLYLQTESVSFSRTKAVGIGLDLYV